MDRPDQHPRDIYLVIEVADSSLEKDMGVKARLYALTGIPTYWVVDLAQRSVRVHTDPSDGEYRLITTLVPGQGSDLVVPTFPDVHIPVDDLFPAR